MTRRERIYHAKNRTSGKMALRFAKPQRRAKRSFIELFPALMKNIIHYAPMTKESYDSEFRFFDDVMK